MLLDAHSHISDPISASAFKHQHHTPLIQFSFAPDPNHLSHIFQSACVGFESYTQVHVTRLWCRTLPHDSAQHRYNDAVDVLLPIRSQINILGATDIDSQLIDYLLLARFVTIFIIVS